MAHKNHYPAIDVLASISRVMNNVVDSNHKEACGKIRNLMASYAKNEDLISIGAYAKGTDPNTDKAIAMHDKINSYLIQSIDECADYEIAKNELINLSKM